MTQAEDFETWEILKDLGFEPDGEVFSDVAPGLSFNFGRFKLSASYCMGKWFNEVVLFTAALKTSRTLAYVEFELPRRISSRVLCAAYITYHLDRSAGGTFAPEREVQWLREGRESRSLLPWEIARVKAEEETAAYNARPRCSVEREWLKLVFKKLSVALAAVRDESPVFVYFDGRVLSFQSERDNIVVAAEGDDAWPDHFIVSAGKLRLLPKRLMNALVDVSTWKGALKIDRYSYNGELPGATEL